MATPPKGILQKSEPHESYKLKWDENKLLETEKLKEKVTMKIDEPNTPFVRYNTEMDQVTNWQDLPESLRTSAYEEPDSFCLDEGGATSDVSCTADTWDDEEEQALKKEARKRHEEFEKKRAQHYGHAADIVFHHHDNTSNKRH